MDWNGMTRRIASAAAVGVAAWVATSTAWADPPADAQPRPDAIAQADTPPDAPMDGPGVDRPDRPPEAPPLDRERLRKLRELRERRLNSADGEGQGAERPRPPGPPPFTPEDRERALTVLRDVNPQIAEKVNQALEGDRGERANAMLARMWDGPLGELWRLKQDDEEAYRLRVADHQAKLETVRLAWKIRQARDADDAQLARQLTAPLRDHLDRQFEIREALRKKELAHLEQRIDELRKELAEHRARKNELVDQSLERILQGRPDEADQPEIGDPGGAGPIHATPERRGPERPRDRDRTPPID